MKIAFWLLLALAFALGVSIALWLVAELGQVALIFAVPFIVLGAVRQAFSPPKVSNRRGRR